VVDGLLRASKAGGGEPLGDVLAIGDVAAFPLLVQVRWDACEFVCCGCAVCVCCGCACVRACTCARVCGHACMRVWERIGRAV
jgi:hypothetical protein